MDHRHASPASPHCVGMGRRHSPWTASRQRKKNRQGDEHLPVCISEDEEAQEAAAMSHDCEDMVLDLQCMGLGALASRSRLGAPLAAGATGQRSGDSSGADQRPQPFLFMPPGLAQQALGDGRAQLASSFLRASEPCDTWGAANACGRAASAIALPCNQPAVSPRRNSTSALFSRTEQGHAAALAALSPMALSSDHISCTTSCSGHPLASAARSFTLQPPPHPASTSVGGDDADQRKSNKRRSLENGMEGGSLSQALRSSGMTTVRDVPREGADRGAGRTAVHLPLGSGALGGGQGGARGLARTSLDGCTGQGAGSGGSSGSPAVRQRRRASVHKAGCGGGAGVGGTVFGRLSDQGQGRDQLLQSKSLPFFITFPATAGAQSNDTPSPASSCHDGERCEGPASRPPSCPPSDASTTPSRACGPPLVPRAGRSSRPPSGRPSPLGPRGSSAATPEQGAGLPPFGPSMGRASVDGVDAGSAETVLPSWGGCTPVGTAGPAFHAGRGERGHSLGQHPGGEEEGADGFRISTVLSNGVAFDADDVLLTGGSDKLARRDQHLRASSVGPLLGPRPPRASSCVSSVAPTSQLPTTQPWAAAAAAVAAAVCAPSSSSQPLPHRASWPGARSGDSLGSVDGMAGVGGCALECPDFAFAGEGVEEELLAHGHAHELEVEEQEQEGGQQGVEEEGWSEEEEEEDSCCPMEGLAIRLIHTEEDFQTPTHSPRADDRQTAKAVGEQLPASSLQGRPTRAHRRTDSSLADEAAVGCSVPAEQLSSLQDFNHHLSQAAAQGNRGRANSLWAELCHKGISPNMQTLNALLRCLANSFAHPDEAEVLAREVCKVGGLSPNSVTYNLIAETRFRYEQLCGFEVEEEEEDEDYAAECGGYERPGVEGLGYDMDECGRAWA